MITGSKAAGNPIPTHLQFQSKAKAKEAMMKLQYDVMDHMTRVQGQFGCGEVNLWPVMFVTNEKGGMKSEEFEKYVMK